MSRYVMTLSLLLVSTAAACTDQEKNKASQNFKDCVNNKDEELIRMDRKKSKEEKETYICDKLGEISTECHKALAKCQTREYVDDKVAIHINSISGNYNTNLLSLFLSAWNTAPCCWTKRSPGDNKFCEETPGNISHSGSL